MSLAAAGAGRIFVDTTQQMKKRILIVEDDRALAKVLRRQPRRRRLRSRTRRRWRLVLERVRAFVPDLVVLDIALPGVNGLDLCDRLWQHGTFPC